MLKKFLKKGSVENFISFASFGDASVFGAGLGERTILSHLIEKQRKAYICSDLYSAKQALRQIKCLDEKAVFLPSKAETTFGEVFSSDKVERLNALYEIAASKKITVVTTVEAALQFFIEKEEFSSRFIFLECGKEYCLYEILEKLVKAGFTRTSAVEKKGEFSLRGDILDIAIINCESGIRCEFFGDILESIYYFSIETKRNLSAIKSIEIAPNTESASNAKSSFFSFFNPDIIFFDDAKRCFDEAEALQIEYKQTSNAATQTIHPPCILGAASTPKTAFHPFDSQNRIFSPKKLFHFSSFLQTNYYKSPTVFVSDVKSFLSTNKTILCYCGEKIIKENLEQLLLGEGIVNNERLFFLENHLPKGAIFNTQPSFNEGVIIIGTDSLIQKKEKLTASKKKKSSFLEVKVGDFVVHQTYGIGFFESIAQLEINKIKRDYALIKYQDDDKVYVPCENINTLNHFSYSADRPKLSKLGTNSFEKIVKKTKASIARLAIDLKELYSKREAIAGYAYQAAPDIVENFVEAFEHPDTPCQKIATKEIFTDLESGKIMDRLLCGDVGFGKTEIALRAAMKVIAAGKQVAFLCPTTILAYQHSNTIKKRMTPFAVETASLTRFQTLKQQKESIKKLAEGKIDIICGTHRLLSKDIKFNDLGLLILDEEQRFGVEDKEKIKAIANNVNVLTLSATPIPRTLHLSLSGIRDISTLETPPQNRHAVRTIVCEYQEEIVLDAVLKEVNRGGQVFILYNRVASINSFTSRLKQIFEEKNAEIKPAVIHGKLPAEKIEDTIAAFSKGEFSVLVASTIIENGIDMPNVNTIIVVDAVKFGLSTLYQLRGRVGRGDKIAYAYFCFNQKEFLTESGEKRLQAIAEFSELGDGFKVALRDLEIRGTGTVLGKEQHGHMEKVGYELYIKLLEEAIQSANTTEEEKKDIKIITDFDAYLQADFVLSSKERIKIYQRISELKTLTELEGLLQEIKELYGSVPKPLENLALIGAIKNAAATLKAVSVILKNKKYSLQFNKVKDIPAKLVSSKNTIIDPINSCIIFETLPALKKALFPE